jgi:hypothetical protein
MEVHEYIIRRVPRSGVVTLGLFACTHIGHVGINYDYLQQEIDFIKDDPWSRWIHLGDAGEYITSNDPRWEIGSLDPDYRVSDHVDEQVKRGIEIFRPIKSQGLGDVIGNHEDKYLKYTQSNPAKRIAEGLGIPFLGYTCLIRLRLEARNGDVWSPEIYAMHGDTHATTPAGQLNYLKKTSAPFRHNVAVMAHVHTRAAYNNEVVLSLNEAGDDVDSDSRHYAIAGTFMKTYYVRGDGNASYAEKKHYPPSAIGCSSIEFHMGDRLIRAKDYLS